MTVGLKHLVRSVCWNSLRWLELLVEFVGAHWLDMNLWNDDWWTWWLLWTASYQVLELVTREVCPFIKCGGSTAPWKQYYSRHLWQCRFTSQCTDEGYRITRERVINSLMKPAIVTTDKPGVRVQLSVANISGRVEDRSWDLVLYHLKLSNVCVAAYPKMNLWTLRGGFLQWTQISQLEFPFGNSSLRSFRPFNYACEHHKLVVVKVELV